MSDVKCPYCGADQEICHDDDYGYEEEQLHNQECSECEKTFGYETTINFSYEAEKVPCLNGDPCNYKTETSLPMFGDRYERQVCTVCERSTRWQKKRKRHARAK